MLRNAGVQNLSFLKSRQAGKGAPRIRLGISVASFKLIAMCHGRLFHPVEEGVLGRVVQTAGMGQHWGRRGRTEGNRKGFVGLWYFPLFSFSI